MPWLVIGAAVFLLGLVTRPTAARASQPAPIPGQGDGRSSEPSVPAVPVSVAETFGVVPFRYTNRPTGPLIGQFEGSFGRKDAPTQTQQDLSTAKMATNIALTATKAAIQAAVALGNAVASSVASVIPFVGAAIGAGFAGASAATARSAEQRSQAIQQGSLAVVSLLPGLGIAALPMAIEGINNAAQRKERAKGQVFEYVNAQRDIEGYLKPVVRASDRLDELPLLVRVNRAQQIAWMRESVTVSLATITNARDKLSRAMDLIRNGQDMIGIPGRNIDGLTKLVNDAVQDAFILYFACRDMLSRYGVSAGAAWPVGYAPSFQGLAGFAGFPGPDGAVWRRGVIPGGYQNVKPSGEVIGWDVAPALKSVSDYVTNRPGWSLWAIVQYFRLADEPRFRASELFARIASSRALDVIFTVTPHGESDVPPLPTPALALSSKDQANAIAATYEQSIVQEEAARVVVEHEVYSQSIGGM